MEKQTYTIDATGKTIGRVATEAANMLRGKNEVSYERHIAPNISVNITNASKAKITEKKLQETIYDWYSGYPGGRREETMGHLVGRKGYAEIFKMAIYGMIPKNKLRPVIMKKLNIQD